MPLYLTDLVLETLNEAPVSPAAQAVLLVIVWVAVFELGCRLLPLDLSLGPNCNENVLIPECFST
jgi:hypothetical protein